MMNNTSEQEHRARPEHIRSPSNLLCCRFLQSVNHIVVRELVDTHVQFHPLLCRVFSLGSDPFNVVVSAVEEPQHETKLFRFIIVKLHDVGGGLLERISIADSNSRLCTLKFPVNAFMKNVEALQRTAR